MAVLFAASFFEPRIHDLPTLNAVRHRRVRASMVHVVTRGELTTHRVVLSSVAHPCDVNDDLDQSPHAAARD